MKFKHLFFYNLMALNIFEIRAQMRFSDLFHIIQILNYKDNTSQCSVKSSSLFEVSGQIINSNATVPIFKPT